MAHTENPITFRITSNTSTGSYIIFLRKKNKYRTVPFLEILVVTQPLTHDSFSAQDQQQRPRLSRGEPVLPPEPREQPRRGPHEHLLPLHILPERKDHSGLVRGKKMGTFPVFFLFAR